MMARKLLQFPIRKPEMFTPEINREILSTGEFNRVLFAAIRALPYVRDGRCQEELKRALCDLFLHGDAA